MKKALAIDVGGTKIYNAIIDENGKIVGEVEKNLTPKNYGDIISTFKTIIEKYQDVIDCVYTQIKKYDTKGKLSVICQDCFDFETDKKFDTIFIDIWPYINNEIYNEEMKPLKRKYRKFLTAERKTVKNIYVWAEYEAKNEIPLR